MFYSVTAVALGFLLDLLLGDPHWMPHPVRWIGRLITGLEPLLRRLCPNTKRGQLIGGGILAVFTVLLTGGLAVGALYLAGLVHPMLRFLLESWLCYYTLAAKSLKQESMKVYSALKQKDLEEARRAVGMIVGRDTQALSDRQVACAAVETVAENTSDGEVAPLFYLAIGGAPLGLMYKAVNTLDSMIGYQNETYRYFGRFAARMDDVANWLPARLAALLMICGAFFAGLNPAGAARIWRRDRRAHKSPNSAQTEAACAGALGVQLAGNAVYKGVLVKKPTIGDDLRPIAIEDIRRANRLLYWASLLALLLFLGCRMLLLYLLS